MTKSPNPIDMHVGRRVRMRRLMLHLSQTALADALRLTFQQVQKYEKGTNRISASRLQQIASFLQVPVAFFFEEVSALGKKSKETGDMPCRFFGSAWQLLRFKDYGVICLACGAPEEIELLTPRFVV